MPKSFGGALMEGVPVVMMGGKLPDVMCRANKKAEAFDTMVAMNLVDKAAILDMMEKAGLITITIVPDEPSKPSKWESKGLPPNVRRVW